VALAVKSKSKRKGFSPSTGAAHGANSAFDHAGNVTIAAGLSLLMAQSGHSVTAVECPLLGVNRT